MSDHMITLLVLLVCGTLLAITLLRTFGLIGLFAVCLLLAGVWPTIQKLLESK
jgi:hypothetical protein